MRGKPQDVTQAPWIDSWFLRTMETACEGDDLAEPQVFLPLSIRRAHGTTRGPITLLYQRTAARIRGRRSGARAT